MTNEDIYLQKEVIILQDYSQAGVKAMDKGVITAYLPEDKIFAIFFGTGKWITFQEEEEKSFLEKIKLCHPLTNR
jgi:hypothetical protein